MRTFRELKAGRRWLIILAVVAVLAVIVTLGVPGLRRSLLRSAGHALVAQDVPTRADVIIISTDVMGAGILESADLVKAGVATRVAIFDRTPNQVQLEFARRGIQSVDYKQVSVQLLRALGLTDILVIPAVVGTEDEGKVLQRWCAANSIRSIVFVSTPDHSRRTRRVLDRALGKGGIAVTVRYSKYSEFDPDTWWSSREGQRTEAVELQKLLLDLLRHPFS
jgi:uncharacterized SAM-binding protein YcdF (DUF218 family)